MFTSSSAPEFLSHDGLGFTSSSAPGFWKKDDVLTQVVPGIICGNSFCYMVWLSQDVCF